MVNRARVGGAIYGWALVIFALVLLTAPSARADWVILKSGEKFQTDRSWSEDGRLKFRLNGLVVSVPANDVAKVVAPNTASPAPAAAPIPAIVNNTQTGYRELRLQGALQLPPPQPQLRSKKTSTKPPPATAASTAAENRKNEPSSNQPTTSPSRRAFRELAWGMRPSSIPGLLLSQTDPAYGGVDEFYHPEEVLQLGPAPITGIVYGFWQNRLYTITVWADGRPSYEKLRRWVLDTYGPGQQSNKSVERRVWYGKGSDRLLEFDEALNTGIFWLRSEKLHARIKQMQAQ
jgi:hypothetical protein